jgi:hypothetical protein
MRPCGVATAGQKKGIFGLDRAKAGQRCRTAGVIAAAFPFDLRFVQRQRVRVGAIDVMSLPGRNRPSRFPDEAVRSGCFGILDHDFVIEDP